MAPVFCLREFFSFVFVDVAFVHETNKRYHPNGKPNRRLLFRGWLVTVLQCADSLIFIPMLKPTPGTPMTRISGEFLRWLACAGESGDSCQHYRRQKVSVQGKDSSKLVSLWRLVQKTGGIKIVFLEDSEDAES